MAFNYKYGKKWGELCKVFPIKQKDADLIWRVCVESGEYTELSLCYIAARSESKLLDFLGDPRFASVFINEVRKYAFHRTQ